MTLALSQSISAIGAKGFASFFAIGGAGPVTYSVIPGGAGGTIDPISGVYTGPNSASSDPKFSSDTIQVVDSISAVATATILVGNPFMLVSEILQKYMELDANHIYYWDQKIFEPIDSTLHIAMKVLHCKPFSNIRRYEKQLDGTLKEVQYTNMQAMITIDCISRGPEARDRKEEVILALGSTYAESQMEANNFLVGKLSPIGHFVNLSHLDGAAIPYRFQISVNMLYAYEKASPNPVRSYNVFEQPLVIFDNFSQFGLGVRTLYSQRPVGLTDWVPVVWNLALDVRAIVINDNSGRILELGICLENAPPNSEIRQILITPGISSFPIKIPYGSRISLRAVNHPATIGENDLDIFF